ncbi:hypothetical protein [Methanosarcina sp.]|uniref:hypothetical protein n=1 Tax=Methanosarcina sp. TaxID=2213 RepID=UPI002ABC5725|nr:hypothetical protein [Methanosarcina sp.]MDY9925454.1 hypothetical protein [Methanosarcina sp.]
MPYEIKEKNNKLRRELFPNASSPEFRFGIIGNLGFFGLHCQYNSTRSVSAELRLCSALFVSFASPLKAD